MKVNDFCDKIQDLESIVIGLYEEFKDIKKTKKVIRLFIKNDIKDMAIEFYGTKNYVEKIIKEHNEQGAFYHLCRELFKGK
jgi:hypothetical protein